MSENTTSADAAPEEPAENPYDVLIEYAIREYYSGQTISLDELAEELNVTLDDKRPLSA
jgi:hypothetical protein